MLSRLNSSDGHPVGVILSDRDAQLVFIIGTLEATVADVQGAFEIARVSKSESVFCVVPYLTAVKLAEEGWEASSHLTVMVRRT